MRKVLELDYSVYTSGTIGALGYLVDQNVQIKNPNASFILTAITGAQLSSGFAAILLKDQTGRAIANEPIWINNLANYFGVGAPLEGGALIWPPNSTIRFDVSEVSNNNASWNLCFWGYLRFEGVKTC